MRGWFITDMHATAYLYPAVAGPNAISINHQKAMQKLDTTKYYWFAPQEFLGNKVRISYPRVLVMEYTGKFLTVAF